MGSLVRHLLFALLILAGSGRAQVWAADPGHEVQCRLLLRKYAPNERQLIEDSLFEVSSQGLWLEQELQTEMAYHQKQLAAFQRFLSAQASGEPGNVYWFQQSEIKALNEKMWSITGAESFLMILDLELRALLEANPGSGTLIHGNFKDRIIASGLTPEEFSERIYAPLLTNVARRLALGFPTDRAEKIWKRWLEKTLKMGYGTGLVEANLRVHGIRSLQAFTQWQSEARRLGDSLELRLSSYGISWREILIEAKRVSNSIDRLAAWIRPRGMRSGDALSLARDLVHYKGTLQKIDFLPIPPQGDPWTLNRAIFMNAALRAGTLIATDVEGFGIQAILARHEWVIQERSFSEIPSVYEKTSRELEDFHLQVRKVLENVLGSGVPIHSYISGDDGLWALPELSPSQLMQVEQALNGVSQLHFRVEPIVMPGSIQSTAAAMVQVRKKLVVEKSNPGRR